MKKIVPILFPIWFASPVFSQADSLVKPKIRHAEPLYIDLIRDLGARKGEREFNFGAGMQDLRSMLNYSGFVEYEFAPVDRLGLEIEVPFQFYRSVTDMEMIHPENRIEGVKLATQYTFLVSEKYQASMAVGYIQEFELASFSGLRRHDDLLEGTVYNPIFIAAKKWGPNIHTLVYAGPIAKHRFSSGKIDFGYQINTSVHYVFPGTGSFIGLETNIESEEGQTLVALRPQIKLRISPGVSLGWVTGIPVNFTHREGISAMVRLIWEPKQK